METYVQVDRLMMTYLLYGMVLVRCSGLVVFAPFFGSTYFPALSRVLIATFLAVLFLPLAGPGAILPARLDMSSLGAIALQELAIGVVLGFMTSMVFMAMQLAGQLMDQQIGFSMANLIDPVFDTQVSLIGFLNVNLAMLLFLLLGLHLGVIELLGITFKVFPIGSVVSTELYGGLNRLAQEQAHELFVVAIKLAMPIVVVMLFESVVVAFVTRTMPQMNIMVLSMPLKIMLGLMVLMLAGPAFVHVIEAGLKGMELDIYRAFQDLPGLRG